VAKRSSENKVADEPRQLIVLLPERIDLALFQVGTVRPFDVALLRCAMLPQGLEFRLQLATPVESVDRFLFVIAGSEFEGAFPLIEKT
jgi:hypothetical protein